MAKTQVADIEAAREALRKATEEAVNERKLPKTKADKVRELRAEIAQFRAQGKTWQEVADVLSGALDVSAATIRQVLGARKVQSAKAKGKRLADVAAPVKARQAKTDIKVPVAPAQGDSKLFGSRKL